MADGQTQNANGNNSGQDLDKARTDAARSAYVDRNAEASRAAHEKYLQDKLAEKKAARERTGSDGRGSDAGSI